MTDGRPQRRYRMFRGRTLGLRTNGWYLIGNDGHSVWWLFDEDPSDTVDLPPGRWWVGARFHHETPAGQFGGWVTIEEVAANPALLDFVDTSIDPQVCWYKTRREVIDAIVEITEKDRAAEG